MDAFATLQRRLGPALDANRAGSTTPHVMIALPSYSVSESLLSHYGDRIPSLEHRYLGAILIPDRIPACQAVYISTRRPAPEVIDYYTSLVPTERQAALRARSTILDIDDGSTRSVAAKLLQDPALIARLRTQIGDRPALIEPWNVTEHEVDLALALGVPINGTAPDLRHLGFKSAGRRLFRDAGVPLPEGREDVRTVADVVDAIKAIQAADPDVAGVVIKHDDSGAGDGNVVVDLRPMATAPDPDAWLRSTIDALPDWYLTDLRAGGVVEARIDGDRFSSPSAQVDIRPSGEVVVLATHEQVLGGPSGQVYLGCRFPADAAYAPTLAVHAATIGERLAEAGALGRFSVDFVAASTAGGDWRIHAIEVNLRKGGTTHPYSALRNLVPGAYDPAAGRWSATTDGSARAYAATDNLVDPAWTGLAPGAVIEAMRAGGATFDPARGTGVVMHMLSGLAIDGRLGYTAIGREPEEAQAFADRTAALLGDVGARRT